MKKRALISSLIILISVVSITSGSLWYDEICRVVDPISGDLQATLHTAMGYAQPGYMLYMFVWVRIAGITEFLLRCSNLPWAVIALLYAFRIVRSRKWSDWWVLAFFVHPMFVYYMDEATPYIILYALALAFTYYTFCAEDFHSVRNIIALNVVYLLGVFAHFVFGFIIMLYFTRCLLLLRKDGRKLFRHVGIMLGFSVLYLPLLYLYATHLQGNHTWDFGIKSIAYVAYSFLGMQGAGLSRNDLRAGNFGLIQTWQCVFLALFVLTLAGLFLYMVKEKGVMVSLLRENRTMLIAAAVYLAVIALTAFVAHWGLWERHCITLFPIYIILVCDILQRICAGKRIPGILSGLYAVLLLVSCYNIRFNYYYSCDDYKGMAKAASEWLEQGKDHVLVTICDEDAYYPYRAAASDPDRQIIRMDGKQEEQVINRFEGIRDRDKMLILFEKGCSKSLYTYYDGRDGFTVDGGLNSFKLITADPQSGQ